MCLGYDPTITNSVWLVKVAIRSRRQSIWVTYTSRRYTAFYTGFCCMLKLYILHASSRLARHAIQPIQRIQRIQLYSYTRYTAYSTIQPPSGLRRPGRSSSRRLECCRKVAPLFYVCPRLRPRRGLHRRSGGDDDAGAPAASRPPLGGRICSWWRSTARAEEPSPEATRVTCSCRIRCWALWLCK